MTRRSNRTISVSSTDVLVAMLSSDLCGSWREQERERKRERERRPIRSRAHGDPAAGSPLPASSRPEGPRVPEEPGATDS
jgi:hypothetical protein